MTPTNPRTALRHALRTLLDATDPNEVALPEERRLEAVRPGAVEAYLARVTEWVASAETGFPADADALLCMLGATPDAGVNLSRIVPARIAARAALALPDPDAPALPDGMSIGQFVTARAFAEHEARVAAAFPAALAAEPGLRCGEWEARHPFARPDQSCTDPI